MAKNRTARPLECSIEETVSENYSIRYLAPLSLAEAQAIEKSDPQTVWIYTPQTSEDLSPASQQITQEIYWNSGVEEDGLFMTARSNQACFYRSSVALLDFFGSLQNPLVYQVSDIDYLLVTKLVAGCNLLRINPEVLFDLKLDEVGFGFVGLLFPRRMLEEALESKTEARKNFTPCTPYGRSILVQGHSQGMEDFQKMFPGVTLKASEPSAEFINSWRSLSHSNPEEYAELWSRYPTDRIHLLRMIGFFHPVRREVSVELKRLLQGLGTNIEYPALLEHKRRQEEADREALRLMELEDAAEAH